MKRRGQEWYAIVLGFKTDLGIGPLPPGNRSYPIFMWVKLDGDQSDLYDVQSCSASLLEVLSSVSTDVAEAYRIALLTAACKMRADMV